MKQFIVKIRKKNGMKRGRTKISKGNRFFFSDLYRCFKVFYSTLQGVLWLSYDERSIKTPFLASFNIIVTFQFV